VVAFSSGGQSPALTHIIREKLEQLLPASLSMMTRIAGLYRSQVKTRLPELEVQRRFWQRLFNGRFARLVESGQEQRAQAELQRELARSAEQQQSEADKTRR
jgi:uroporphyrin-III C-methyltransferase/precorrin-2 dehydrogenase/sirohydrochlorin ferrochelatase